MDPPSPFHPSSDPSAPPLGNDHGALTLKVGKGKCLQCGCQKGTFNLHFPATGEDVQSLKCLRAECHHEYRQHANDDEPAPPPTQPSASATQPSSSDGSDGIQNHLTNLDPVPRWILRRQDTVSKLAAIIDAEDVIHIRGTPASGKTVLSRLLQEYYESIGRTVFLLPMWPRVKSRGETPWMQLGLRVKEFYPEFVTWDLVPENSVVIIDEAQRSYGNGIFWCGLLKDLTMGYSSYKIKFCLFCSYGSPQSGVQSDWQKVNYIPPSLGLQRRVTLTPQLGSAAPDFGLFYTKEETFDAISLATEKTYDEPFELDDAAKAFVYDLTNGHPGGVVAVVDYLQFRYRPDLKRRKIRTITLKHVLDALSDEDRFFQYINSHGVYRSFPDMDIEQNVRELLGEIVAKGSSKFDPDEKDADADVQDADPDVRKAAMEKCYKKGWIHRVTEGAEQDGPDVVVLPSRLHEKWSEWYLGTKTNPISTDYDTLEKVCWEVLRNFSQTNLRNAVANKTLSTAAQPRPMDGQYQDEFYRAFYEVVGKGRPLCSEWSKSGDGRVDFYIPEKKWVIELLRDHDRIEKHIARFHSGGTYHDWLQTKEVLDWIIIDCASEPPEHAYSEPRFWTAVFSDEFSLLQIWNHRKQPLFPEPICLHN